MILKKQPKYKNLSVELIQIVPTTAAFTIIPDIISLTLFSHGKFDHYAVQQTAATLLTLVPNFIYAYTTFVSPLFQLTLSQSFV